MYKMDQSTVAANPSIIYNNYQIFLNSCTRKPRTHIVQLPTKRDDVITKYDACMIDSYIFVTLYILSIDISFSDKYS